MKQMLEKYTEFGRKSVAANGTNKDQIGDNANADGDSEELEPEKEIFILAFPTNDFRQETGTNEEIAEVVQKHLEDQYHNPNFILFHKSTLVHNPIYKMLREHMPEADVKHNFYKYLIGRDGVPVGFYTKKQSLFDFESAIVEELESF
jgi:glutathione peroxidase